MCRGCQKTESKNNIDPDDRGNSWKTAPYTLGGASPGAQGEGLSYPNGVISSKNTTYQATLEVE